MPPLSAIDVVNAVVESTREYYRFLTEQNLGHVSHHATNIQKIEGQHRFFDNTQWQVYRCRLQRHLSIRQDSSATFVAHTQPGAGSEIYLLTYDRHNGQTTFATSKPVPGETGAIVIDFRWLVKRCLEWYEQRGSSVAEIGQIETSAPRDAVCFVQSAGQSAEQFEAVQTMLTTGLSYIWGPPGTGKTTWVLGKAVCHCVEQNEKILVLASTNLAVDNALNAILREGICKEMVLRIGIPSDSFRNEFPECCEERAFQEKLLEINREMAKWESVANSIEHKQEYESQRSERQRALHSAGVELSALQTEAVTAGKSLQENETNQSRGEQELRGLREGQQLRQTELDRMAFSEREKEVQTLEAEQAQTIMRLAELRKQIKSIGWIGGVFTDRKRQLNDTCAKKQRHLEAVEGTLLGKRRERDDLVPRVTELKKVIEQYQAEKCSIERKIAENNRQVRDLTTKQRRLRERIAGKQQMLRQLEVDIEDLNSKLSDIGNLCPAGTRIENVDDCQIRIAELKAELNRYRQDISSKMVLGMTLDGFIGFTLQMSIVVNRVFIDEAPYAPLAKVLPVLCLHRPIAMLGDHYQLPPICEEKANAKIRAYWAKPSIFLEDAFTLGNDWETLDNLNEARHELMLRHILRDSYRFGPTLAHLLDRHVYHNGLRGLAQTDTTIKCVHCTPFERPGRKPRENDAEADEIIIRVKSWWEWVTTQPNQPDPTLAILTPYKNQRTLIGKKLAAAFGQSEIRDHIEVWNTHQAQGREWDYVFFSASDTGRLQGNNPWFSDSSHPTGRALVNTTISRAKQHLRIFVDVTYWRNSNNGSILKELAQ